MRITRKVFQYIEKEMYAYHATKRHLKQLHDDILHSTPPQFEIRSTAVSDPTFYIVCMLTTHKLKLRMEEIIFVIDLALVCRDNAIRDAIEDKYWERPRTNWEIISFEHNVDRKTLYRWRKEFITDVATKLGMT